MVTKMESECLESSAIQKDASVEGERVVEEHIMTEQVREKIGQIRDPLWRRTCEQIFRVLGPQAFSDLWRVEIDSLEKEGKQILLFCPSYQVAATIKSYHFVILDALKTYFPSLREVQVKLNSEGQSSRIVNSSSGIVPDAFALQAG